MDELDRIRLEQAERLPWIQIAFALLLGCGMLWLMIYTLLQYALRVLR